MYAHQHLLILGRLIGRIGGGAVLSGHLQGLGLHAVFLGARITGTNQCFFLRFCRILHGGLFGQGRAR